ncbi:YD repeat-containing protein [Paraburkholderia sp. HC6.4b]|nr:LysM peptidoglycan-binding domain-containing protein [Paraburkholderia sp. Kb1A]MBB5407659.1 YD repeat-containing protein [Paraburkholderia sp. HC6.4b]MBB5452328.1 YD repeat-containing protein [Paraburkholderia sp. Kb1A]
MAPLTTYYYDLTGNLVGLKDANGHLSTQQWNYGLAQPAVAQSWDAMGYSKNFSYDAVGNLRVSTDELGRRTDYTYDRANQLIEIARPVLANGQRSVDRYEYDGAGNRIAHTDALGGRERIYYDADGRIVKTVSAAGRTVQYDYRWASTISSIGSVASGGWVKTTIDANGRSMVDEVDLFGRVTKHTDLGGHVFQYTYNWAGLLTKQEGTSGQHVEYSYYSHGLVRSIMDYGTQTQSLYEYDGDGNRTAEFFTDFGNSYVFAQSRVEYDALNRVVAIRDNSYQVGYEYDAVGNRRRMMATYTDMVGYHATEQEYWYEYDALNRFTVSMGSLSGTRATDPDDTSVHIVAGAAGGDGVQLGYNAAGERTMAVYARDGRTEYYTYDANGLLATQTVDGMVIRQRTNDLLGRVTEIIERDRSSGQIVTAVTRDWDADSQLMSEHDNIEGTTTTYTRMADGTLGQVATRPDNGSGATMTSTYSYEWWDSAKQSQILAQGSNPDAPGWRPASSYFNYDVNGNLKATYDDGGGQAGSARAFTYYTDLRGQVQRRDELVGVTVGDDGTIRGATGDRKHNYYYLNGNRVGNQGNDGVETVDYVQELAGKLAKGSESQYKVFTPVGSADFDENFMAINGVYPGVSPGTWTVRDGDTLQSIASSLWGDATLWYILADANGLKGDDVLKAGQMLTVPNQVTNVHNTATTFKPYDPGKAIGNTQPTLPDPPPPPSKDGGCGPVAAIIAVVVAAVATVFTAGAASMALAGTLSSLTVSGAMTAGAAALVGGGAAMGFGTAVAASVIGGAVGAAAAQGVMIAAGEQSGFNWKGVAMGAVGAAVGSSVLGVTGVGTAVGSAFGGSAASQFAGAAAQGAIRSVTTQGLGVLTGAQHSFDWKGVAASAIASGVAYGVGAAVRSVGADFGFNMQSDSGRFVTGVSAGVAAGAASTIVRGGSLGRNVGAISMDAVASTIGNLVVSQVQAASVAKTATSGDGSMSALYGVGGNYDDLVRQTTQQSYNVSAGDQFAGTAGWSLALQGPAASTGAASAAGGYVSGTPSPYGGAAFNAQQARIARIAEMQLQAANPADVRPGWGELNVLVTGVGSRGEAGEIRALPLSMRERLSDPSVADTPGGAILGFAYSAAEKAGDVAALFSQFGLNPVTGEMRSPGQLQRTKEDLVINAGTLGVGAFESGAVTLARQQGQAMLRSAGESFGPQIEGMFERAAPGLRMYALPEDMAISSRVGPPIPRLDVSDQFSINRYGGGVSIDYLDAEYGSHGLNAYIDQSQRLSFEIRANGDVAKLGSGKDMFASMMLRLDREGIEVNGITGTWVSGTDSVNAAEYARNLAAGMSKENAALNTWTGRLASSYGYTSVIVPDPVISNTQFAYFMKLGR